MYFEESRPLPTDQGLKTKRTKGSTWWSRRWIGTLENLLDAGRLRRGRRYARQGQVLELRLGPGAVTATVQGSRRTPYQVRIGVPALSDAQWDRVAELLSTRALYVAQLLAGDVPPEIEAAFAEVGAALLPEHGRDLEVECTCPDWADVCKHAGAVAYLVAERFDDDPFLLFELRGRDREGLLAALTAVGSGGGEGERPGAGSADSGPTDAGPMDTDPAGDTPHGRPLGEDLERFWGGSELPAHLEVAPPAVTAHLLKRLGPFAGEDLAELLSPSYRRMSERAVALWRGDEEP